jgi:hypothetical protein
MTPFKLITPNIYGQYCKPFLNVILLFCIIYIVYIYFSQAFQAKFKSICEQNSWTFQIQKVTDMPNLKLYADNLHNLEYSFTNKWI